MSAITCEDSFISTNRDMGEKHIEAHKNQHDFLQKGEPPIITLTDNKPEDLSTDLALKYGIDHGLIMKRDEWEKYNKTRARNRRKANYEDYLLGLSSQTLKGKQKKLDNAKTPKPTREKLGREISSILQNGGLAIDGTLFYLGSVDDYEDKSPEELKKYKHFEDVTFTRFFNSDKFKKLNPQVIRAEIHHDEIGRGHMQMQSLRLHKDSRGRVKTAKRAITKNVLKNLYAPGKDDKTAEKELQHRLDILCYVHDHSKEKGENKENGRRSDADFKQFISTDEGKKIIKDGFPETMRIGKKKDKKTGEVTKFIKPYYASAQERKDRLDELWRIENMTELRTIAVQTAKELGVDYKVTDNYVTDGQHRGAADYVEHRKNKKTEAALNQQLAEKNKQLTEIDKQLKTAYKAVTGQKAKDKDGNDLSIEKTVEGLKKAVTDLKTEADEQENRKNKAQKEADDLANDNVQAMASLLKKQTQTENENDQLEKLKKLRQQREQEAQEQQQQQQQTFQENEKLLATQSESLNGLKAQTAEEAKKLQRLKNQQKQLKDREAAKKTDQRELRRKAAEYDKIEKFVGTPPKDKNMTLSEWVKNRFTWLVNQNSLLSAALTTAKKLRIAAAKGLRVLGKLTGKEFNDALTGNNDGQITAKANKAYNDWRNSGKGKQKKREDVWDL